MFELRNVDVRFGPVSALADVSLSVMRGERLALVGANGSGKSTLLRLLHGLVPPSAGSFAAQPAARQAMLFQRPHMLRGSAQNHIALGLWLRGSAWREARAQALQALARVELQAVAQRNARALSGGQQQRLALARAWALKPEVLLLDEPTASLDPHAKREIEALVAEFGAQDGMTLVFSSHNLGQVKRLASRVVYLEQGRLLADLPVEKFFNGSHLREMSQQAHLFLKGELA